MNCLISLLCCISILSVYSLQAQPACDKDKQCIGRAVQMTETYGRGAHFIEVSNFGVRDKNQTALTVERTEEGRKVKPPMPGLFDILLRELDH